MHGLVNRSLQCFLRDTYGGEFWNDVVDRADVDFDQFEALKLHADGIAHEVSEVAADLLGKPVSDLLEDLGSYLVSHPNCENIRRLLRFGGDEFPAFLASLNELPDRVRMAVDDLILPRLDLREHFAGSLTLTVLDGPLGAGHVIVGVLRAMADDYGSLALFEHLGRNSGTETVSIRLLDLTYSEGRAFALAHVHG